MAWRGFARLAEVPPHRGFQIDGSALAVSLVCRGLVRDRAQPHMRVIIVGAGIGGLTAALALHKVGIDVEVFDQARELAELGVGINLLPHATRELAALGLLPALDAAGIRTRELIYTNRLGQVIWREPRGTDAGYNMPQFSIHRGKLHKVLLAAAERLGDGHIHTGCALSGFESQRDRVIATFQGRDGSVAVTIAGDALVGCDGIHSTVRRILYPSEGPPVWNGIWLWRGATDWPSYQDGRTMVIAGGNTAKFVFYPIHQSGDRSDRRLTNWGIMAGMARAGEPPPQREDWSRLAKREEVIDFARQMFQFEFVDAPALIAATERCYEYPNCDRDPLPRWSFSRITLLGDAAHPMYPVGSNGASQAILDARALARQLADGLRIDDALLAYDEERRPLTSEIIFRNRQGGPEQVIDVVEAHAPFGFDDINAVLPFAEREALVKGYARLAGYSVSQVNR
jgi:5-methylphenazine-1-carboxylate 1-monooxygenase